VRLVTPSDALRSPFFRLVADVQHAEEDFAPIAAVLPDTFDAYLARLDGMRTGSVATRAGVPISTFWLLDDAGEIVGFSTLRHRLTPALTEYGGHIGFAVRPSARRRGVGVALLAQTLDRARDLSIDRALVTCDVANLGSRGVIERCGGVLDAEYVPSHTPVPIRRYHIDLAKKSSRVP
jgi:predicted acetyltransferase